MNNSARPTRGRQARPTKPEINAAWAHLKGESGRGNVVACALLVAISEDRPVFHVESGVENLPGHGGWHGDHPTEKARIIDLIRANNPQSKQLPENQ